MAVALADEEEDSERVNEEEEDDKMPMLGVNDSDNLDGDDILDEAAKLAEWL